MPIFWYRFTTFRQQAARHFASCATRSQENLPSTAPKPTVSIRHISQNAELYAQNCLDRNYKIQADHPAKIVGLLNERRKYADDIFELRSKSKRVQAQLTHVNRSIENEAGNQQGLNNELNTLKQTLLVEAQNLKHQLSVLQNHETQLSSQIGSLAAALPNLTSPETPRNEHRVDGYINQELKPLGKSSDPDTNLSRDHVRLATELDLIDFTSAAKTSGWGWYYLKHEAVRLEHALVQYALSVARKHGFADVTPQSMVYSHIASACGFRPRDQNGEQQIYAIERSTRDFGKDIPSHVNSATAEIPFAGMKADESLDYGDLPIKVVGSSRCFRAEAGARGAKTRGLYRVHEFTKVEMFAWTAAGEELEMFDRMLQVQTEILTALGLHCRILEMPASDLGASAYRKKDIEAYFPSRQDINEGWGEVTSTSICTDYQTRRLNTRMKYFPGSMRWPSTVNGTAVAVPRILALLLEYRCEKRDDEIIVKIPEVLRYWIPDIEVIKREKSYA